MEEGREEEQQFRRARQANYAKRQRPPTSAVLSHVTTAVPLSDLSEPARGEEEQTSQGTIGVRWLRRFTSVPDNMYGLPLDSSASSTTAEGRLFMEEGRYHHHHQYPPTPTEAGVWSVPTSGNYLISVVLVRNAEASASIATESSQHPRAVVSFDGTCVSMVRHQEECTTDRVLEWRFPIQPVILDQGTDDALHPQQWMQRVLSDRRNGNTDWLTIDAQHKRQLTKLQRYVAAETGRRQRYGKQHFHFYRVMQMLDENFEKNKQKLAAMEIEEQDRQLKLEAERLAAPSPAEFFGRVFRLRQGVRMRIGLSTTDGTEVEQYAVMVSSVLLGDLTGLTIAANGKDMPFAQIDLPKPFGCFRTAKRFASGEQLIQHLQAKEHHLTQGSMDSAFKCHICPKSFLSEAALKEHLRTRRHVRCATCGKRFLNDVGLQQHLKNKHERDKLLGDALRYPPWFSKAPRYNWKRPKFCCEKENCGRQFMTTAQLEHHHKSVKHIKCVQTDCEQLFFKKTDMYRHFKDKHDSGIYVQGLVQRLQEKLNRIKSRAERDKFGGLRWATKREQLEVKLARALGIPIEEYRRSMADKPLVTEGAQMAKSPTAHSVINIVPPRAMWDLMQKIRTLHVSDARCGPHISFVEPFVMPEHYTQAAELLKKAMSKIEPFEITLSRVEELRHEKSSTIYLSPDTNEYNAIQRVLQAILEIFPQCSDLLSRGHYDYRGKFHASGSLSFHPHVSLRKMSHDDRPLLNRVKEHYEQLFEANPVKFLFKELYILNRIKGDPFEVCHIIPLGPPENHTQPYFGPGSPGSFGTPEETTALGRSVLLGGIPQRLQESVVMAAFHLMGLWPKDIEVVKNPDGARRSCAVVELATVEDTRRALDGFDDFVMSHEKKLEELGLQASSLYIRHMPNMMFPGPPGDCCSLRHIKAKDLDPPEEED